MGLIHPAAKNEKEFAEMVKADPSNPNSLAAKIAEETLYHDNMKAERLGLINQPSKNMVEAANLYLKADAIYAAAEQFKKTVEQFGFRSHENEPDKCLTRDQATTANVLRIMEDLNEAIEVAKQEGLRVKVRLGRGALAEDGKHLWADISRPIELNNKPPF